MIDLLTEIGGELIADAAFRPLIMEPLEILGIEALSDSQVTVADPRHHLVVACAGSTVVGMATALHYVHPDKPPELWINEVGVAPPYRRRALARGCSRPCSRTGGRSAAARRGSAPRNRTWPRAALRQGARARGSDGLRHLRDLAETRCAAPAHNVWIEERWR